MPNEPNLEHVEEQLRKAIRSYERQQTKLEAALSEIERESKNVKRTREKNERETRRIQRILAVSLAILIIIEASTLSGLGSILYAVAAVLLVSAFAIEMRNDEKQEDKSSE